MQLGQCGLLERLGGLEPGRAQFARRPTQDPRPRAFGAVDTVAEAHQSFAAAAATEPGSMRIAFSKQPPSPRQLVAWLSQQARGIGVTNRSFELSADIRL